MSEIRRLNASGEYLGKMIGVMFQKEGLVSDPKTTYHTTYF